MKGELQIPNYVSLTKMRKDMRPGADAFKAYMGVLVHSPLYTKNAELYLEPSRACQDQSKRNYIHNMLEYDHSNRHVSGLGRPDVSSQYSNIGTRMQAAGLLPSSLFKIAQEELGDFLNPVVNTGLKPGTMRLLWNIIHEMPTYRMAGERASISTGLKPIVNETAGAVQNLELKEIMRNLNQHRPKCRRHPIWMVRKWLERSQKGEYLSRRKELRLAAIEKELQVGKE